MIAARYKKEHVHFYIALYFATFRKAVSEFGLSGFGGGGGGGCPSGFTSLGSLPIPEVVLSGCMYVSQDRSLLVSWATGQKMCKQMDSRSNLPFFTNMSQIAQFQRLGPILAIQLGGKATVWFGGYQSQIDNTWYFLDGTKMIMDSTGGWQDDTPNTTASVPQRCLSFTIGGSDHGWRDSPCSSNFSFGCFLPDPTLPIVNATNVKPDVNGSSTLDIPCPPQWTPTGGFCYQSGSNNGSLSTFGAAAAACKALDPRATLPQFFYESDWTDFTQFAETLHPNIDHQYLLLGGQKLSGSFVNSDKSWTYSNWYAGEPTTGECIFTTDLNGYMWNTTACSRKGFVICQLNSSLAGDVATTTTTTTASSTTSFTSTTTTTTKSKTTSTSTITKPITTTSLTTSSTTTKPTLTTATKSISATAVLTTSTTTTTPSKAASVQLSLTTVSIKSTIATATTKARLQFITSTPSVSFSSRATSLSPIQVGNSSALQTTKNKTSRTIYSNTTSLTKTNTSINTTTISGKNASSSVAPNAFSGSSTSTTWSQSVSLGLTSSQKAPAMSSGTRFSTVGKFGNGSTLQMKNASGTLTPTITKLIAPSVSGRPSSLSVIQFGSSGTLQTNSNTSRMFTSTITNPLTSTNIATVTAKNVTNRATSNGSVGFSTTSTSARGSQSISRNLTSAQVQMTNNTTGSFTSTATNAVNGKNVSNIAVTNFSTGYSAPGSHNISPNPTSTSSSFSSRASSSSSVIQVQPLYNTSGTHAPARIPVTSTSPNAATGKNILTSTATNASLRPSTGKFGSTITLSKTVFLNTNYSNTYNNGGHITQSTSVSQGNVASAVSQILRISTLESIPTGRSTTKTALTPNTAPINQKTATNARATANIRSASTPMPTATYTKSNRTAGTSANAMMRTASRNIAAIGSLKAASPTANQTKPTLKSSTTTAKIATANATSHTTVIPATFSGCTTITSATTTSANVYMPRTPSNNGNTIEIYQYWSPPDWLLIVLVAMTAVPIFCCTGACVFRFLYKDQSEKRPFHYDF